MTHLLALLLCAAALGWAVRVLAFAAVDLHRRGVARVHAGRSFAPRCCLDGRAGRICDCEAAP